MSVFGGKVLLTFLGIDSKMERAGHVGLRVMDEISREVWMTKENHWEMR